MVGKIGDNFFRSSKGPPAAHEFTSAEVLKTLSRQPKLKFAPGSEFEYSNSGYEVLGQIIERVSCRRYAEFLKETIFDPLGMHDTLVLDERRHSGPRLALAYRKRNGRWQDITYSPENYEYGDGGGESTANDLFKWDQALSAGKNWFAAPRSIRRLRRAAPTTARSSKRTSSNIPALMDFAGSSVQTAAHSSSNMAGTGRAIART